MDTQRNDNPRANRRLKTWEIVCLAVGSPIWLSLLIAVIAVIVSIYVSVWAVIISLWAVFGSLLGGALGSILAGIGFVFSGHGLSGLAMIGAGLICTGLSIFLFFGCRAAAKGAVLLTKKMALRIKNRFSEKEAA